MRSHFSRIAPLALSLALAFSVTAPLSGCDRSARLSVEEHIDRAITALAPHVHPTPSAPAAPGHRLSLRNHSQALSTSPTPTCGHLDAPSRRPSRRT